jgi:homoserine dehydrogenase
MNNKIALIGFGAVGQGYFQIASKGNPSFSPSWVGVKDRNKSRPQDISFHYNSISILENAGIGIEVISETDTALQIARALLSKGKTLITANKKLIAGNLPELLALESEFGGKLLYEAAVAASIPILSNLTTQYQGDEIHRIQGILNGSSNYILSKIFIEGQTFESALQEAQANGFAEADPSLDINGSDVASKLSILAAHAFQVHLDEASIPCIGIDHLKNTDFELAKTLGLSIKLIANATASGDGVSASILPTLIQEDHPLSQVEWEYNAVSVTSANVGLQTFQGKGAGSLPTGSAVYNDLVKSRNGFKYSLNEKGLIVENGTPLSSSVHVLIHTNKGGLSGVVNRISTLDRDWFVGKVTTTEILGLREKVFSAGGSILALDSEKTLSKVSQYLERLQEKENLPA